MPASGPVYQPTTVTYEQQTPENGGSTIGGVTSGDGGSSGHASAWTRPVSYLSQTVTSHPYRARLLQWLILLLGIFCVASGLIMLINGSINYSQSTNSSPIATAAASSNTSVPNNSTHSANITTSDEFNVTKTANETEINIDGSTGESAPTASDARHLICAILGAVLLLIGILLIGIYIRICRRRKACTWWRGKDLTSSNNRENGVAASAAMNPSTDLLVTAQYAPVSEVAYQPPAALAAEERSKLMAENKDCVNTEENERMLESDPRIVLRPQSHTDDTA